MFKPGPNQTSLVPLSDHLVARPDDVAYIRTTPKAAEVMLRSFAGDPNFRDLHPVECPLEEVKEIVVALGVLGHPFATMGDYSVPVKDVHVIALAQWDGQQATRVLVDLPGLRDFHVPGNHVIAFFDSLYSSSRTSKLAGSPNSIIPIFLVPEHQEPVTVEITMGTCLMVGCGAKSMTPAGTHVITSIVSGFDTREEFCPGSGIDAAFFDVSESDDPYCKFDFGAFSNLAPMTITTSPVGKDLVPLDLLLVAQHIPSKEQAHPPDAIIPDGYPSTEALMSLAMALGIEDRVRGDKILGSVDSATI